jgi:hypothetical protein
MIGCQIDYDLLAFRVANMKHFGVALTLVGLVFGSPTPSSALPSISVVSHSMTTGALRVTTTETGVLGAEVSIVLTGMKFTGVTINSAIFGLEMPGDNPFLPGSPEDGDTTGLWLSDDQQVLFASYESQQVKGGTYQLLQFEYETFSPSMCTSASLTADGFISVNGVTTNVPAFNSGPLGGGCSDPPGDTDSDGDIDLTDLGNVKNGFGSTNPLALGDTNGDSLIDIVDLNNVKNNFGAASPPALGDTDGNGNIDLVDLNNVKNNFGATAGGAVSVPEPASALLVLAGVALAATRRRV